MDHSEHSIHNTQAPIHMNIDHSHHGHAMIGSTPSPVEAIMPLNHDHNQMHDMGHGGDSQMQHMMSMAFHFGCHETILFTWWKIDSNWGLVGSFIGIFMLALLYEGLKYYREYLFWKTYNLLEYRPVTGPSRQNSNTPAQTPTASAPTPVQYVGEVIHKQPPTMLSLNHVYQTFLHVIQVTLSFLLMLIFMTYNVWLCMAVVLGAAVGYFLFCWKKSVIVDVTEHCH